MERLMNVLKLLDIIKSLEISGIEDGWIISGLLTFLDENQIDEAIYFFNSIDTDEIKAECENAKDMSLSNQDNLISLIDLFKESNN